MPEYYVVMYVYLTARFLLMINKYFENILLQRILQITFNSDNGQRFCRRKTIVYTEDLYQYNLADIIHIGTCCDITFTIKNILCMIRRSAVFVPFTNL